MKLKYFNLSIVLMLLFLVVGVFSFINIATVQAETLEQCFDRCVKEKGEATQAVNTAAEVKYQTCITGCRNPVVAPAASQGYTAALVDPLGLNKAQPIADLAKRLIMTTLGLVGVLALLAFIYGGVLYMLVGVKADNVKKGKEVMKWAVAGLFLIFSAYAILNFLFTTVLGVK